MKAATGGLLILILALNAGCAGLGASSAADGYGAAVYAPSTQDWWLRWQAATPQQARQRALADCAAAAVDCHAPV